MSLREALTLMKHQAADMAMRSQAAADAAALEREAATAQYSAVQQELAEESKRVEGLQVGVYRW